MVKPKIPLHRTESVYGRININKKLEFKLIAASPYFSLLYLYSSRPICWYMTWPYIYIYIYYHMWFGITCICISIDRARRDLSISYFTFPSDTNLNFQIQVFDLLFMYISATTKYFFVNFDFLNYFFE